MLFLFPVKYGVNAQRFYRVTVSRLHYYSSILENYLTKQHAQIVPTSITQPTLSFYLQETCRICNFHANCYHYNRIARHRKFTKCRVKLHLGLIFFVHWRALYRQTERELVAYILPAVRRRLLGLRMGKLRHHQVVFVPFNLSIDYMICCPWTCIISLDLGKKCWNFYCIFTMGG